MKHCPNPQCRYRVRYGAPADYQDSATSCSDCQGPLADGPAPALATVAAPQGASPWNRVAVSALALLACVGLTHLPLPGTAELAGGGIMGPTAIGILALGIGPVVSAYALVELLALLVPAWRTARLSGHGGRARLRRVAIPLSALIAVVQAVGVANYLRALSHSSRPSLPSFPSLFDVALPAWAPWAAVVLLPLGTLVFALLAAAIDRWGLGDGLSMLIAGSAIPSLVVNLWMASRSDPAPIELALLGLASIATVVCTWLALGRLFPFRIQGQPFTLELPPCGIDPLTVPRVLLAYPVLVCSLLGLRGDQFGLGTPAYSILGLLIAASLGGVCSLLYNQPRRVASVWFGPNPTEAMVGAVRKQLASAAILGTVLMLGIFIAQLLLSNRLVGSGVHSSSELFDLALLAILTAVVRDLLQEWRFRRGQPKLVPVWPVHRVYAVQPALRALEQAGIAAFPRGLHHRTLLQFFGPFVPITLLVPPEKADDAARILRELLLPGEKQQAQPATAAT
jgi:hypothetical protein